MYDITGSFLLWESVPMVAGSLGGGRGVLFYKEIKLIHKNEM